MTPRGLLAGAAGVLATALLVAYPFALDAALSRLGVRFSALALLALTVSTLAVPRPPSALKLELGPWPRLAAGALLLLAALLDERTPLLLIPAVVYASLAALCWRSLDGGGSLVETGVRRLLPEAPDFIAAYCRGLTRFWAGFFASSAAWIAWLALAAPIGWWAAWTGWGLYALMAGLSLVELAVRKARFRYYFHGGPIDRLFARLFPAEATPLGRRSLEAIRRYREEQAARAGSQPVGRTPELPETRAASVATDSPRSG